MNLEEKIKGIISDFFYVDPDEISGDSGVLKGDIKNWDSLGQLQLILGIEAKCNIKFSTKEIQDLGDFDSIVQLAAEKMG